MKSNESENKLYKTLDELVETLEQDIIEIDNSIKNMRKRYNMDKINGNTDGSLPYALEDIEKKNSEDNGDYIKRLEERILQLNIEYKTHLNWVIRG
jgi:hypothetical protein